MSKAHDVPTWKAVFLRARVPDAGGGRCQQTVLCPPPRPPDPPSWRVDVTPQARPLSPVVAPTVDAGSRPVCPWGRGPLPCACPRGDPRGRADGQQSGAL